MSNASADTMPIHDSRRRFLAPISGQLNGAHYAATILNTATVDLPQYGLE